MGSKIVKKIQLGGIGIKGVHTQTSGQSRKRTHSTKWPMVVSRRGAIPFRVIIRGRIFIIFHICF